MAGQGDLLTYGSPKTPVVVLCDIVSYPTAAICGYGTFSRSVFVMLDSFF